MKHDKTNKTEQQIFNQLFKFRFLTTRHIQQLLNHKLPTYTQTLLKKLTDKQYLKRYYSRETYQDSSKPAIYFLATKARKILKKNEDCDGNELDKIYNAKNLGEKFIQHCLIIADIYFLFLANKKKGEELHFFTKAQMPGYDYFPENLPDAYMAVKSKTSTKRYFLDLFDPYTPPRVVRRKIREYISYKEEGNWQEETGDETIPSIYLVLPNENMQKHISIYAKAKFEKEFDESISLSLTTVDKVRAGGDDIWQKIA